VSRAQKEPTEHSTRRTVFARLVCGLAFFAMIWLGDGISAREDRAVDRACRTELQNLQQSPSSWFVQDRILLKKPDFLSFMSANAVILNEKSTSSTEAMVPMDLGLSPGLDSSRLEFSHYGVAKRPAWWRNSRGSSVPRGCVVTAKGENYLLSLSAGSTPGALTSRLTTMVIAPMILTVILARLLNPLLLPKTKSYFDRISLE
jgi:hypothetical protein